MAINMMCANSECEHYWEDNCMRNIYEERIEIDEEGRCVTFKEGINEVYNPSGLKVYFDGDSNWYASPWDIEKTKVWLIREHQLGDALELEECDLNNDGMCNGGIGDLRRVDENLVEKFMSFKEVIKLQGDSQEPYLIATTNY